MNFNSFSLAFFNEIKASTLNPILLGSLFDIITSEWIEYNVGIEICHPNESNNLHNFGFAYPYQENQSEKIKALLINGSQLPKEGNEGILLLQGANRGKYQLNSLYNLTSSIKYNSSISINITGIIELKSEVEFLSLETYNLYMNSIRQILGIPLYSDSTVSLLVSMSKFEYFVEDIGITTGENIENYSIDKLVKFNCRFNSSLLQVKRVSTYISNLNSFKQSIYTIFPQSDVSIDNLQAPLLRFQNKKFNLFLMNLIFSSPLLVISFLIQSYSKDPIESRKNAIGSLLATRGIKPVYLLINQFFEIGLICVISYILGSIFGNIALIIISPEKYASNFSKNYFNINSSILVLGLLYTFYGYKNIVSSTLRLILGKQIYFDGLLYSKEENKFKMKYPIIAFCSLIGLILIENFQIEIINSSSIEIFNLMRMILTITSLLSGLISIISISKYGYLNSVSFLSNITWPNYSKTILVLTLKNLARFKKQYSKIWMILILLSIYSIFIMTLVTSFDKTFSLQAKFENNSKIKIKYHKDDELQINDYLRNNVTSNPKFTSITTTSFIYKYKGSPELGGIGYRVQMLGIDPENFFQVSFYHEQFLLTPSFQDIELQFKNENSSIVMSISFLEENQIKIGDKFNLSALITNLSRPESPDEFIPIAEMNIVGSYGIFPITNNPYLNHHSAFLSKSLLEKLENDSGLIFNHFFLLNTELMTNQEISFLENNFDVEISLLDDVVENIRERNNWNLISLLARNNSFYSLALCSIGLFAFNRFIIGIRVHERAIERVIGLKRRDSYLISLLEGSILIFSSVIVSMILGLIFTMLFIKSIYPTLVPTYFGINISIIFPVWNILFFLGTELVVFLFFSIPHFYIQQRYNTSILLKKIEI